MVIRWVGLLLLIGMVSQLASGQLSLLRSVSLLQSGGLCGVAHYPYSNQLWVIGCSNETLDLYDLDGFFLRSIPMLGGVANDVDLEIAPEAIEFPRRTIEAGQLLLINGEYGTATIFAIDPGSGRVLDTLETQFGVDHVVGGAYHPERNSFFLVQDRIPSGEEANRIAEVDPTSGDLLNVFDLEDRFSVYYGDLDISACTGNLFLVSSDENAIAEWSPEGDPIREIPLPSGVNELSGISLDCTSGRAWLSRNSSSNGAILVEGFDCGNCLDCKGVIDGTAEIDTCGLCLEPSDPDFGQSCLDCRGVPFGEAVIDSCGNCLEPSDPNFNQACADCNGIPNGPAEIDSCGSCLDPDDPDFNASCTDCNGVVNGGAVLDDCGLCLEPEDPDFNKACAEGNQIYIPNVFSPNGDGINDRFRIYQSEQLNGRVQQYLIFDRWGNQVYEAVDFGLEDEGRWWDGRMKGGAAASGSFVYSIELVFPGGNVQSYRGSVGVVR